MAFGFRKPSWRKRVAARTSVKRYIRHSLGLKAPRGWGWLTNPRKAAYNRIYRRTTFGIEDLIKLGSSGRHSDAGGLIAILVLVALALLIVMALV